MTFCSISIQPQQTTGHSTASTITNSAAALMGMLLALYIVRKSKKEFRKLRRKFTIALIKNKFRSLFSRKRDISTTTLLYILLGLVALALIIIEPLLGIAVLLIGILVILLVRGGLTASGK